MNIKDKLYPSIKIFRREKMEYIIGAILAIIVIITAGLILRKRLYDKVDYYETWKLDVMNRNIAAELSKMKDLNMKGDTKVNFEMWKEQWDTILTEELATVEELLYDTEKAADKYSFPTAKKHMKEMEMVLLATEDKIETIVTDVHALLETEEKNRQAMETLVPQLQELRKFLSQNRYKFNKADVRFEADMDEMKEIIDTYDELIEAGNYDGATEQVEQLDERMNRIKEELDEFPGLYKKCKQELPAQLEELTTGINEMIKEGYSFNQTELLVEIGHFQSRLLDATATLEKAGAEDVKPLIPEIEDRMKEMYNQLEDEALARNFVEAKMPNYEQALEAFAGQFGNTIEEVEVLKQAYHFEASELEKYHSLEKQLTDTRQQLQGLLLKVAEKQQTHSSLRTELEQAFARLQQIEAEHELFKQSIDNLRKDELVARNELQSMNEQINKINRQLRGSNLPGVPNFIWRLMEEATGKSNDVLVALGKEPLDIMEVQQALAEAKSTVEQTIESTNKVLEQAFLTEQVIQYANRYRSSFPELATRLEESERLFRKAEYELALENAAQALEELEPGALKRIEQNQTKVV